MQSYLEKIYLRSLSVIQYCKMCSIFVLVNYTDLVQIFYFLTIFIIEHVIRNKILAFS